MVTYCIVRLYYATKLIYSHDEDNADAILFGILTCIILLIIDIL